MEKRFKVKRFLFETTGGEAVCRFMLTDCLLPMLAPNQYIEIKSVNKVGTGKNHAYKLCVFLASCTNGFKPNTMQQLTGRFWCSLIILSMEIGKN